MSVVPFTTNNYELVRTYTALIERDLRMSCDPDSTGYMAVLAGRLDGTLHQLVSEFPEVRAWVRKRIGEGRA